MRFWWVNQNQTHEFEVAAGFLWSPKTRADGGRNYFYNCMQEVQRGDVVFSYFDGYIQAIGVVQREATTAPKPDFRSAGSNWSDTGWYVEVEFKEIVNAFKPKDFIEIIRPHLPGKYSPLQVNGNGLQGVYLTEISSTLGQLLVMLSKSDLLKIQKELAPVSQDESEYEINLEIEAKQIKGDLERIQLTKSRRGQGIFKANVRLVENRCRITGVSNIKHLRASHIKPWSASNNLERLDGYNGLLLSPHIDHLFDRGFISFENSGELLVSKELNPRILEQWSISYKHNVGDFKKSQCEYLEYHREIVFKN